MNVTRGEAKRPPLLAPLRACVRASLIKGEGLCRFLQRRRPRLKRRMRRALPTLHDFTALSGLSIESPFRHLVH